MSERPDRGDESVVRLVGVTKRFGPVLAVDDLTVDVAPGEFFSLLGPSGCGKTTTLRMIGGFDEPDEGTIFLGGRDVSHLPAYRRNVNTVFQSYALFPHLSVFDNVAYGLRRRRVAKDEVASRVERMLALVDLPGLERRRPVQLSGGQQQRVALARALVNEPQVLLLDEPLGALDLKLRRQMQLELKRIQHEVGITFIYVTHDQEEAMTMSDRIAVMNAGRVEQIGAPEQMYEHPASEFVAGFLGASNLLDGVVRRRDGEVAAVAVAGEQVISVPAASLGGRDGAVKIGVRPEKIRVVEAGEATNGKNVVTGVLQSATFVGANRIYAVEMPSGEVITVYEQNLGSPAAGPRAAGARVTLAWQPEHTFAVVPATGQGGPDG